MKRGSAHKPDERSQFRIYGTADVLNNPTRKRRASQEEAHRQALFDDLKRRLREAEPPMVLIKKP